MLMCHSHAPLLSMCQLGVRLSFPFHGIRSSCCFCTQSDPAVLIEYRVGTY